MARSCILEKDAGASTIISAFNTTTADIMGTKYELIIAQKTFPLSLKDLNASALVLLEPDSADEFYDTIMSARIRAFSSVEEERLKSESMTPLAPKSVVVVTLESRKRLMWVINDF